MKHVHFQTDRKHWIFNVLSSKGRDFGSSIIKGSSALLFSVVSELEDEEIVCISGIFSHCLAVSKKGRVFGFGSNDFGILGLDERTTFVSSFTEISSLNEYKIRSAFSGVHDLYNPKE